MIARRVVAILAALFAIVVGSAISSSGASTPASAIDTNDRALVKATFRAEVRDSLLVSHSWTGSTSSCKAGSASQAYDQATLDTINWFRRMNGLPAVRQSDPLSVAAQRTALMMHAAEELSHYPTDSWPCHTDTGAETAGISNLTLGISGPRGVLGQIEDAGPSNVALGHRRWLLFPRLTTVGIGNTSWSGVVSVIGGFGSRPPGPDWISWPPEGYVPARTVAPRWSVSYNSSATVDFGSASVSMKENGRPVDVHMLPIHSGYGDETLAFEPVGISPDAGTDVVYDVTINGIIINGRRVNRSWTTIAFDSQYDLPSPKPSTVECLGHRATIIGSEGTDLIHGTAGRDVIVGLGGNDVIHGLGGEDIICGGDGNDEISGGEGSDRVIGGAGHDLIRGGGGADVINGQGGRDRLVGNQGHDRLVGGDQRDVLIGNSGHDTCWVAKPNHAAAGGETRRTCEAGR